MIHAKEALERTRLSQENARKRFCRSIKEDIIEAADKGQRNIISLPFIMEQNKITYVSKCGNTGDSAIEEAIKGLEDLGYTVCYEIEPYYILPEYHLCISW